MPMQQPRASVYRQRHSGLYKLGAAAAAIALALATNAASAMASTRDATSHKTVIVAENFYGGSPPEVAAYQAVAKAFNATHPNVEVVMKTQSFTKGTTTGILELTAGTVPSVYMVNEGFQALAEYVKDNLLVPLDGYAAKYHWSRLQNAALMSLDGRQTVSEIGQGTLWGMSSGASWVGVMYNKALLKKIGQAFPTTLSQFEHDLALAKTAGEIPIAYGTSGPTDIDGYWWFLLKCDTSPSLSGIRDTIEGVGHHTWVTPQTASAAATLARWGQEGYFNSDYAGLTVPEAMALFAKGNALFYLDGDWDAPAEATALGKNFGMLPLPSGTSAHGPEGLATGQNAWAIPKQSPDHALAAEFINYLVSPAAGRILLQHGYVPASTYPGELNGVKTGSLLGDEVAGFKTVSAGELPMPFPDWSTPNFLNDEGAGLTEVMAHKITPTQFARNLQSAYLQFRSTMG